MFMLTPPNGALAGRSISKSLRFNIADSASLTRTFAAGNRKTWTWSAWVKRASLGAIQSLFCSAQTSSNTDTVHFLAHFKSDDTLAVGGATTAWRVTTQVFRDPAAHYHIVVAVDTTQATAGDRIKLYVNGVQITAFSTTNNPAQGADLGVNIAQPHSMGARTQLSPNYYFGGYMSDIQFVDGQALTPASFGVADRVTGQWVPKKYTGTYGTNGFYLPFNDGTSTTTLGYDRSGNANNWTLNNFSVAAGAGNDWLDDTPTNNYCVLNSLFYDSIAPSITEGALVATLGNVSNGRLSIGTIPMRTGKWYAEFSIRTVSGNSQYVGVIPEDNVRVVRNSGNTNVGAMSGEYAYGRVTAGIPSNSTVYISGSAASTGLALPAVNDIIGIAFDADAGTMAVYLNNSLQSIPSLNAIPTGKTYFFAVSAAGYTWAANFGQQAFAYAPPTGYKALCTKNLPAPAVKNSAKHFDVKTYTGNGSTNSVAGVAFQPDLVWGKVRSTTQSHALYDVARGATKTLSTNTTAVEATAATALTSFNSDGFSMGSSALLNQNAATYVSWLWKAGGTPVSNTDGTIVSQVSANPAAGFSVVTFTGTGANATVGHGLGVAPAMVIVKRLSAVGIWTVGNVNLPSGFSQYVDLSSTGGFNTATGVWNNTSPSSTVFSVGTNTATNGSGSTYVAYCFAEVPGYSALGKYTGNGSANGPFVYCGFKPKYVLVKRVDAAAAWHSLDGARDTANEAGTFLYPNLSNLDSVGSAGSYREDFLSNGFKLRGAGADINAASGTYIFVAFAEAPFKYSCAR